MKHWKIILALLALVLLSGFAGALLGHRIARDQARRRSNPEAWNISVMRTLDRRLKPTPAQHEKLQAIIDAGVIELKTTRLETMEKTNRQIDKLIALMEKELTPEQTAEFDKLRAERKPATLEMLNVEPRKDR